MPFQSKTTLKGYFAKTHPTTEAEYGDLIDSMALDPTGSYQLALGAAMASFMAIPGLSAFYPGVMGLNTSATPQAWDRSPNGLHLTWSGGSASRCVVWGDVSPALYFAGTQVAYRADASPLDMTGDNAYLASQYRGITVGGWFRPSNLAGTFEVLLAKSGIGNTINYRLQRLSSGQSQFVVSSSATNYSVQHSTLSQYGWYFIVGRFRPSTSVDLIVNGVENRNLTSIPATIDTNNEPFTLGARSDGAGGYQDYFTGYSGFTFLSQAKLPDTMVQHLYDVSKALYV